MNSYLNCHLAAASLSALYSWASTAAVPKSSSKDNTVPFRKAQRLPSASSTMAVDSYRSASRWTNATPWVEACFASSSRGTVSLNHPACSRTLLRTVGSEPCRVKTPAPHPTLLPLPELGRPTKLSNPSQTAPYASVFAAKKLIERALRTPNSR
eukprot:scaffold54562_cov65-Phaeocystis_antarctica.AAC.3